MKTKVLSLGLLVLSWLSILCMPAAACPPPPPPPPPCSGCPGGCPNCWGCVCSACQCAAVIDSINLSYNESGVGCVGDWWFFSVDGSVASNDNCNCVTWSAPGADPASQNGGCVFWTHWDTPGEKTVIACTPCSSKSRIVTVQGLCGTLGCCGAGQICCNGTCCNPNQKCCSGECKEKCRLVDGQNCSGPGHGCLAGCAKGDTDCDWVHGKEYCDFGVEKICNPRGCEGDCLDGEIACYYDIPCVPRSVPVPLSECVEISPGYWTCQSTYPEFHLCYYCTLDEPEAVLHTAQFDYCFSEP